MTVWLEDLEAKGCTSEACHTEMLSFVQDDLHGYAALDKYEYAIGLKRGSLSKPNNEYTLSAPVHESLVKPFRERLWSLLPHPIESLHTIVKALHKNIQKPYGMQSDLSDLIPRRADGMFLYRILYLPSILNLSDRDGHTCQYGSTVLSPVHPFLVLASLSRHSANLLALKNPLIPDIAHSMLIWDSAINSKGFNERWIEDGWEDVLPVRPVPEHLVADFEPEADLDELEKEGIQPLCIWNDDPDFAAYRESRIQELAEVGP